MKNLSRNSYFYLSLVLAAALAFQVYGVVSAQTAEYKAPTQPPTGGMPAAPVNTGTTAQVKQGQFGIGPNSSTAVILESSTRRITFGDGNARGSIYLTNANGGELWVQHGANAAIKIGTGTGTGGGDLLWEKTDPALSVVSGPNIFYKNGAVFIGDYPKTVGIQPGQQLYFPRYKSAGTHTKQEGIDFNSYNFVWEVNSATTNGLSANARLACDTDNASIKDCFGASSLESGSASTPAVRYNVAASIGGFTSGPYAQVYDKADSASYQYVLKNEIARTSAHRPRLWCDTDAGGKSVDGSVLGGNECPDTLPAPPPGAAGGWPDEIYDYTYGQPCTGNLLGKFACTNNVKVYRRQAVSTEESPPPQHIRLNPSGSAEFAGGKVSISTNGTISLGKGQGILLTQGFIFMNGDISATNLYLGGEIKVNGKRVYQIVGGCELMDSRCKPETGFGDIMADGECASGARRIGGEVFAFCAY